MPANPSHPSWAAAWAQPPGKPKPVISKSVHSSSFDVSSPPVVPPSAVLSSWSEQLLLKYGSPGIPGI